MTENTIAGNARRLRRALLSSAGITALCLLAYANGLRNDFTYDDKRFPDEGMFSNPRELGHLFTRDYFLISGELSYRPLVTATYFLDFSLWGYDPFGYKLANLLWHIATAWMVLLLLGKILRSPGAAFLGGAVFAVHPVLTEAVNSVGFREDLICAFFFLAAIFFHIRRVPRAANPLRSLAAPAAFALALLAKEMAATLPLVLILYDRLNGNFRTPDGRTDWKSAGRAYSGYLAVAMAYGLLRFVVFHNPAEETLTAVSGTFPERLIEAPKIFALYLGLFLAPFRLSVEYDDALLLSGFPFAAAALVFLGYLFLAYCWKKSDPRAAFFLFFIPVSLLPVLNLYPLANPIAERYLYLPAFGFAGAAAIVMGAMVRKAGTGRAVPVIAGILAVYVALTISRNTVWKDSLSLWSDAAAKAPGSARVHLNMGLARARAGEIDSAIALLKESIRLRPGSPDAYNNLGSIYFQKGDYELAEKWLERAIAVDPADSRSWANLSRTLYRQGEIGRPMEILEKLVEHNPWRAEFKVLLAAMAAETGDEKRAEELYREALHLRPYNLIAGMGLANLYLEQGRWEEADGEFRRVAERHGESFGRSIEIGNRFFLRGAYEQAEGEFRRAVSLRPDRTQGFNNLGMVQLRRGDYDSALENFDRALKIEPGNIRTALSAAQAAYLAGRPEDGLGYVLNIFKEEAIPEVHAAEIAEFFFSQMLHREAADAYREITRLRPEYGWGYYYAARAFVLLGESRKAAAWLQRGMDRFGSKEREAILQDPAFRPF